MSEAIEVIESDVAVEELTGADSVTESAIPSWLPAAIVLGTIIIFIIWFVAAQYQFHAENAQLHEHLRQMTQDFNAKYPNTNMKP